MLKSRIRALIGLIASFLPTPLPKGYEEHKRWANSILELANCPDNDSTRFALAVMIMHCSSTENRKPKYFFVKQLEKAASNEIANNIAQEYKMKQQQRLEETRKQQGIDNGQGSQVRSTQT